MTYTVGAAIGTLTLPSASGGDGELIYSLRPEVAGLTFNPGSRTLSGTPTTAGTYGMTYTVADSDADLTITVDSVDEWVSNPRRTGSVELALPRARSRSASPARAAGRYALCAAAPGG